MENMTDMELIAQALDGDRGSFAALVDRHYLTVYRYAFRWCRSREDAEDIAQEVFIKLAAKLHQFDNRSRFTSWLYRITANCAKDMARKSSRWTTGRMQDPPDDEITASPNPGPENNVLARSILAAIEQLPVKQKEAMLLVYAEGMNHREASRVIGCAESTVSWRVFQAKRQLKKVLA